MINLIYFIVQLSGQSLSENWQSILQESGDGRETSKGRAAFCKLKHCKTVQPKKSRLGDFKNGGGRRRIVTRTSQFFATVSTQ